VVATSRDGDYTDPVLSSRGVRPDVAEARKYRRYDAGAGATEIPELVAHPRYLKKYGASPGLVMPKCPVMEGLDPIRPQLRSDNAIKHEPWSHRHNDMPKHELKAHLASKKRAAEHEGVGPNDEHWHTDTSKYVLGPGGDDAKRLDCNPLTDFSRPGRVFFVIEGCIKADSLVSCDEKAFDVPAVAQWAAPELPLFAREHLKGERVFVVPDSDWAENSEVIFHAICCREYLRRIGVDAHIAAPPPREEPDERGEFKQGVDDFLGPKGSPARRHSPDQLLVLAREVDEEAFAPWWYAYHKQRLAEGAKFKTLALDEQVARLLILASSRGRTLRGVEALTKALMAEPRARTRPDCGHQRPPLEYIVRTLDRPPASPLSAHETRKAAVAWLEANPTSGAFVSGHITCQTCSAAEGAAIDAEELWTRKTHQV
jgi:hypothetical protein